MWHKQGIKKEVSPILFEKKPVIVWVEISVTDLTNSINFYKNVLRINISEEYIFNKRMGVFKNEQTSVGFCLVEVKRMELNRNSVKPMFYVNTMFDSIQAVNKFGGVVVTKPAIMKQVGEKGENIIGSNLIDGGVGFYAEVEDPDGNVLFLYSNS